MADGVNYLASGLCRLGFREGDRLCVTGGVGQHYLPVLPDIFTANTVLPLGSPVVGAVRLAGLAAKNRPVIA
jgi:glucosamine kinase